MLSEAMLQNFQYRKVIAFNPSVMNGLAHHYHLDVLFHLKEASEGTFDFISFFYEIPLGANKITPDGMLLSSF